jgi:NAD(P)H-hydrate epimerase
MKTASPALCFDRAGLREIDRRAVDEFHIPILTLMENAGRAVAEVAHKHIRLGKAALVVCGPGNNGGDGLVAARHLSNAGVPVQILLLQDRKDFRDAAAAQLAITDAMGIPVKIETPDHAEIRNWIVESDPLDILIDAIFGTGLSRPVEGLARDVIHAINVSRRTVIAVDIPSGLDCDTGKPLGDAIRAAETVSFCGLKPGFKTAPLYTGKISVADIGAPALLLKSLALPGGG